MSTKPSPPEPGLKFTPKQQAAVAFAVTLLAVFGSVLILLRILGYLASFFSAFSHVFLPLLVAGILAFLLRPMYLFFRRGGKVAPALALTATYMTVLLPILFVVYFFGAVVVREISNLADNLPQVAQNARDAFETRFPEMKETLEKYEFSARVRKILSERGTEIAKASQAALTNLLTFSATAVQGVAGLFNWAVLPVYLAFMLMGPPYRKESLDDFLPFLKIKTRKDVVYLINEFIQILVTFFRGQLLVALAQGLLFAIGFALIGLKYGFLIGLTLGFLNIVPYLGSIMGLSAALPTAFFQDGGGGLLLGLTIGVFVVVQIIEGYVLTPRIMGKSTGLHPMVIMIAIFFWGTALNGIAGMLLAIPLTAFLVVFWRLLKKRYISPII